MVCGFYQKEIEQNADLVRPALNYADVEKNAAAGKISSILTIEDGLLLEGKIERVDEVYERG